jgi:hypothetical protein
LLSVPLSGSDVPPINRVRAAWARGGQCPAAGHSRA